LRTHTCPPLSLSAQLPCDALGQPLCAKSADPNELWPMLIEKAYAKLHTCYQVYSWKKKCLQSFFFSFFLPLANGQRQKKTFVFLSSPS
jgi:hypothetical protein